MSSIIPDTRYQLPGARYLVPVPGKCYQVVVHILIMGIFLSFHEMRWLMEASLETIVSASRSPPGQDPKRCHFLEFSSTWDSLLPLWKLFVEALLAILGPLLEHFWVHVSNNGAKGAPRGATPKSKSPFWTQLGGHFSDIFTFLMKKHVLETHLFFFVILLSRQVLLGMGSHAIRSRRRSRNTLFHFHIVSEK